MITMEEAGEPGYEARMMIGNTIEGLLKFRIKKTDGASRYCYEITSKQPLSRLLETRTINAVRIQTLLLGIAGTLTRMEDYLLTEEQILLDPDQIYVNPETYDPFLCLIPGKKGDFPEEFSQLLRFLLGKTDHQDKEAVVLIYGLYRESLKENYGLDNLLSWLMKEKYPKVDYPGRAEGCETIDQKKIESWETEAPKQMPLSQSYETEKNPEERKPWYWYLIPAAVMLMLAAAIGFFYGIRGFITYGIWLVLAGVLFLAAAMIFCIRFGYHDRSSSHQTVYYQTSNSQLSENQTSSNRSPEKTCFLQQVQNHRKPSETAATTGQWRMVFEEEEPEPASTLLTPESEEMNTVLLWNQEEAEKTFCLEGEDGSRIRLSYYPFIIGKQEGLCDCVIPKTTVSRLHLRIDRTEEGCQITDLNSTNGTYVNGRCLAANETVTVQPGDEIVIADLKYRLK